MAPWRCTPIKTVRPQRWSQEGSSDANNYSMRPCRAEKHLRKQIMSEETKLLDKLKLNHFQKKHAGIDPSSVWVSGILESIPGNSGHKGGDSLASQDTVTHTPRTV